ncbi:MAG: hypothetical protein HQL32_11315 [Planctomycetes bacterium]|nr:hypothetical protein [Planctomycetota bacterium]
MKFKDLVASTNHLSCFRTSYLGAGNSLAQIRLQLDRWEKAGKVKKVTKGVYSLSPPYINAAPNVFSISSTLRSASYVSLQSALAYYGLIPEYVPNTLAITTGGPWQVISPFGSFFFRHIKDSLFWGYEQQTDQGQSFFVATPEKALLDLLYITAGSDNPAYVESLRLQNCDRLDIDVLHEYSERMKSKKVSRALVLAVKYIEENDEGYEL